MILDYEIDKYPPIKLCQSLLPLLARPCLCTPWLSWPPLGLLLLIIAIHKGLIHVVIIALLLPPQGLILVMSSLSLPPPLVLSHFHPRPLVVLSTAGLPHVACLTSSTTCSSCVVPCPPLLPCCPSPRWPWDVHQTPSSCYLTPACPPTNLSQFDCCVHYSRRILNLSIFWEPRRLSMWWSVPWP
jgi:hypothetical protein